MLSSRHACVRAIPYLAFVCALLAAHRAFAGAIDDPATVSTPSTLRVRSGNTAILQLIAEGAARSPKLSALIDTINHTDGIVYVEYGYCRFGHVTGCLLPYIVSSSTGRYLRVLVTPDGNRLGHDERLAIIGHELQHAIEVIAHPEVVDLTSMERMYSKLGMPLTGGLTGYETSAARAAGDAVLADLRADRASRRSQ